MRFDLLMCFILSVSAVERIWFIRHCDKPLHGPCCTSLGYDRSRNWHKYLSQHISTNLTIYTSGTRSTKTCMNDPRDIPIIKHCPRSHRMLITAHLIHQSMPSTIRDGYCTGDTELLLSDIQDDPTPDVLVVWQHEELAQMVETLTFDRFDIVELPYETIIMVNMLEKSVRRDNYNFNSATETSSDNDGSSYLLIYISILVIALIGPLIRCICIYTRQQRRRGYEVIRI